MVLRFRQMLAAYDHAKKQIDKACRDLSMGSLVKFRALKDQFYIMDNGDLFISDELPEEESGYIMKTLRAAGLLEENAEIIVPCRVLDKE